MAVAQGYGKTVTSGSVFAYDTGDVSNSYIGAPTTNICTGADYSIYNDGATNARNQTSPLPFKPGYEVVKVTANTPGTYGQSILWTATYSSTPTTATNSVYAWLESGTYVQVGQHWHPWNYGSPKYIEKGKWVRISETYAINEGGSYSQAAMVYSTDGVAYFCMPQYELKPYLTPFVNFLGTRSATQGLLPLVGNSTINLSNVSFDSNAQMVFDGTNDYVNLGASSNWAFGGNGTVELMVKPTDSTGNNRLWCVDNNSTSLDAFLDGTSYKIFLHGGVVGTLTPLTQNAWNHVVVTYTGGTVQIYINGTPATMDGTTTGYSMSNSGTLYLGCYTDLAYNLYGEIPVFKTYNRALTTSEIKQNFRHYRTRFGMEYDTYYFAVSNRNARYVQQWWEQEPILDEEGNPTGEYITLNEGFVKGKNMAATTPAYTLYRKPSATNTGPGEYVEVARDDIGTPTRLTQYGVQTKYPTGRYFTSVTVRKDNATGEIISFEFPDGGTSQYGEAFYKTIITPYVP